MNERDQIYAILYEGRIVALADKNSLEVFKPEYRESAILLDPMQVPQIKRRLESGGGLSSKNMPTQWLDSLL